MSDNRFNASHCLDPTVYEVFKKLSKEEKELSIVSKTLLQTIETLVCLVGFELVELKVKDVKSRRVFEY